ncbi:hypothetical protein RvY_02086-2 [Ramazzottius varieornatus]|nr:hypothetical protein RvY_02086-2 [Ramazzottius varieornatus]
MMPLLASFRENFMDRTEFVVLPFEDLPTFKLLSVWKEHYLFDPEAERHTIENYILWNNKINFGTEAIKLNPFKSSYFVWCDIGSFRQPQFVRRYVNFPSPTKVAKHGKDRMTFMSYMPIRKEEYLIDNTTGLPAHDFLRDYRIHCPVFTGHQKAWDQYARLFYSTLRLFIQSGRFAGKDQNIVTSVSVMYPNSTTLIRPKKFFGHIGSYFHYYFS